MVKRLLVGLFLGLLVGLAVAAALTHGLNLAFVGSFGVLAAYVTAAVTGMLVGLVTGKPIWSATGKIEAGLKAFFGALIAAGLMFAMRRWLTMNVNLAFLSPAAQGRLGDIPYATLPAISALLGGFFEADNTPEAPDEGNKSGARVRIATPSAATSDELDDEQSEAPGRRGAGR